MENEYVTGLPPGPAHDYLVKTGKDYVILILDDGEEMLCMVDPSNEALSQVLRELTWSEWARVRAESADAAMERYFDAHDQWDAKINGSPRWQDVPLYSWEKDAKTREVIIDGG